jgi:endo-1,4-beta-xylanase
VEKLLNMKIITIGLFGLMSLLASPLCLSPIMAQNSNAVEKKSEATTPLFTLPLRAWGQKHDMHIGAAVAVEPLRDNPLYWQTLAREFSKITPENVMKMGPLRPARDQYFWDDADAIVDFAEKHAMQIHGHTLAWHIQQPKWITDDEKQWTRETAMQVLKEHIFAVVGRYKGRLKYWDVVNEAIEDNGSPRDTVWRRIIGPDYIELAFRWAHEADPGAKLLYNDYSGEGLGKKSDKIYELVRDLKQKGVPIHGVGLQMHLDLDSPPPARDIAANMKRLGELGLEVHVTEMDVRIKEPITPEKLEKQGQIHRDVMLVALQSGVCKTFTFWGISDARSWIPGWFKGYNEGLPFNRHFQPKPAYHGLIEALSTQQKVASQ